MAIALHPHKALLRRLTDFWLLLYVEFVPYINNAFTFHTDPATSSWGTRTSARTYESDMTAEHAISCLCDELNDSLDESGRLDDARQIAS